jgi:N-acetylneuraminic acid mutarotase
LIREETTMNAGRSGFWRGWIVFGLLLALLLPAASAWAFASAGSLSTARYFHTTTLLPNGKVLVAGGLGTGNVYLASAELYDPATNTWSAAGSMSTARRAHTATLLPNGKVLVAGGFSGSALASAELYDPATNSWTPAGSLSTARYAHTATMLPNGTVLVAGGSGGSGPLASAAELYDPSANRWTPAGSLSTARFYHTATLLKNGTVLVVGGYNGGSTLASAELYNPTTNSWGATGSMSAARYHHTATLLPNGNVLVAGGSSGGSNTLTSAELYNRYTNSWSVAGSLSQGRSEHTATLLPNGTVLVAGGFGGFSYLASAELYDSATDSWSAAGSLSTARSYHTTTLLPNGTVLVAGGFSGSALASAELYEPQTNNSWSGTGSMSSRRAAFTATLLPDGQVLVAGGQSEDENGNTYLTSAELYDPATGTWSPTGSSLFFQSWHTATLLPSGKVLAAGGSPGALAELYDPATGSWSLTGAMNSPREGHTAALLPNGKVLVAGGFDQGSGIVASTELYDPATNSWSAAANMGTARAEHTATLLPNGKVLVVGGTSGSSLLPSAELYDPTTNSWSEAGSLSAARYGHTATLLTSGKVMVAGGFDGFGYVTAAELYDPATNSWTPAGSHFVERYSHTATLLPSGKVLMTGGTDNIRAAEVYDPATNNWSLVGNQYATRLNHTATLLPNGKVLVAGGWNVDFVDLTTAEIFDPYAVGFSDARRPVIASTEPLLYDTGSAGIYLAGSHFRGDSEGSGGGYNNSSSGVPILTLERIDNSQRFSIGPYPQTYDFAPSRPGWSGTEFYADSLYGLPVGQYRTTITANGIPSLAQMVTVAPEIFASVNSYAFGEMTAGGTVCTDMTLSNEGAADLILSDMTSSSPDFTVSANDTLPLTLIPGATHNITACFESTTTGNLSGNIIVQSNAAQFPQLPISVSGTVVKATPVFSDLAVNQFTHPDDGQEYFSFTGTLSAPGSIYPAENDANDRYWIRIGSSEYTFGGTFGPNGYIESNIPVSWVPPSATPYTITYTYEGSATLNPASNSSTTLTVLPQQYALNVTTSNGRVHTSPGTDIDCAGSCSQNYDAGTMVTLTPEPASGYTFTNWSGACTGTGTCQVTMDAAKSVTATFALNSSLTYTLNASVVGGNGTISPPGATVVPAGGSQTFAVTPAEGYKVDYFAIDGAAYPLTNNSYTLTKINKDRTVTASFSPITYTIAVTAGANGQISPHTYDGFLAGSEQTYTITPDFGYHVESLTVDGAPVTPATTHTFTGINENHAIAATFAPNPSFTITASAGTGGSITSVGETSVLGGTHKTYTITPDAGYVIENVVVDGVSKGAITGYTFTNVSAGHTIAATFASQYTITAGVASAAATGTIDPAGATSVAAGGSQTYTFAPAAGYRVKYVAVNGAAVAYDTANNQYTFSNVKKNSTISVYFEPITYKITVTQTANGSISPYTYDKFKAGANQTYTIKPKTGYVIKSVVVDGMALASPVSMYTFTNITDNHSITATFGLP